IWILLHMLGHGGILCRSEGRLSRQHQHWASVFIKSAVRDDDEVLPRISHAIQVQRFHRLSDYTQSLAWPLELPARDGNHAVGLQVVEVFAKCVDSIEIVFAHR